MRKFYLLDEMGGSVAGGLEPAVVKFAPGLTPVLKHPGHGDQKVHGRKGGSSTAGFTKRSNEEMAAHWEKVAREDWESPPDQAKSYGKRMADLNDFYDGPNGTVVKVERGNGVTDEHLKPIFEQTAHLQKVAPNPGLTVEISKDAYRRFNAPDEWGGFAEPGKPELYLNPRTVKDGINPGPLMGSAFTNPRQYALTHEWGHTVDRRDSTKAAIQHNTALKISDGASETRRSPLSPYGKTDKYESYAESFAEFHLTGGSKSNPVVAYFAEENNWGSGEGSVLKAKDETVTLLGDSFTSAGPGTITVKRPSPFATFETEDRKAAVAKDAAQLTAVLKHPGHGDQKVHGRRGSSSVDPEVAASILSRVKANGGLSVSMMDGSEPVKGFMVAKGGSKGAIVDAEEFYDPVKGPEHLSSFLKDHRSSLTKGSYLGLWHNTEDGKVYLDVSDNIMDEAKATSLGRRRDQISIWDVANFREIDTGGTGQLSKSESVEGDSTSRSDERDGRGDRQDRSGNLEQVRQSAVIKFAPGLVPVLKHGDPSRPGYATMHPDSQGRVGVHTGMRTELKDPAKGNANLVHEATSMESLPEALQARINEGVSNLGASNDSMDSNIETVLLRAKAQGDPAPGQDWYDEAHNEANRISEQHGLTREQSAGMIAATSPQQPWGDNVTAVDYMAKSMKEDHEVQVDALLGTERSKKMIKGGVETKSLYEWAKTESENRKMDGSAHPMPSPDQLRGKRLSELDPYVAASIMKAHAQMGYKVSGIGSNVDGKSLQTVDDLTNRPAPVKFTCGVQHLGRAVRISRGESPNQVLNGHKVRSFYNNIRDPRNEYDDVTVDSHAFSIAMGKKYGSGSAEYNYFAGAKWKGTDYPPVSSATQGVSGLYPSFADSYRRVGRKYGLSARQVQAITWVQWRKDNPDNVRGAQMREDNA